VLSEVMRSSACGHEIAFPLANHLPFCETVNLMSNNGSIGSKRLLNNQQGSDLSFGLELGSSHKRAKKF
jgi:hypothetical protein